MPSPPIDQVEWPLVWGLAWPLVGYPGAVGGGGGSTAPSVNINAAVPAPVPGMSAELTQWLPATDWYSVWALKRVRTEYTGSLIRVRRASDNAELDVGYVAATHELDWAAIVFFKGIAANAIYVTKWFDQSGNGKHVTQPVATMQPELDPSLRKLKHDHATDEKKLGLVVLPRNTPYTIAASCIRQTSGDPSAILNLTHLSNRAGLFYDFDDTPSFSVDGGQILSGTVVDTNAARLVGKVSAAGAGKFFVNGTPFSGTVGVNQIEQINIGGGTDYEWRFRGDIAFAAITLEELTDAECQNLDLFMSSHTFGGAGSLPSLTEQHVQASGGIFIDVMNDVYLIKIPAGAATYYATLQALLAAMSATETADAKRALGPSGLTLGTVNQPFIGYDASGNKLGWLLEGARTQNLRNSAMAGASAPSTLWTNAVVMTADNLTTEIVGSGTSADGFEYVTVHISGTPNGSHYRLAFEAASQVTAANANAFTASFYARLSAGALTNLTCGIECAENVSGVLNAQTETTFTPTSSALKGQRVSATRLMGATVTHANMHLHLATTNGQAVDITLDIAAPQLEQRTQTSQLARFPSSFIRTTSAAVTRAVDIFRFSLPTGLITLSAYTQFCDFISPPADSSRNAIALQTDGGSNTNRILFFHETSTGDLEATITSGGAAVATLNRAAQAFNARHKMAASSKLNDFALSVDGNTATTDTGGAVPATMTQITFGDNGGNSALDGYIKTLALIATDLSDADLATITAP